MKTTLEIDDELYREAKAMAALTGRKMKDLVSEGLRYVVRGPGREEPAFQVLGCLKEELKGKSVEDLMTELRGPVELPPDLEQGSRS